MRTFIGRWWSQCRAFNWKASRTSDRDRLRVDRSALSISALVLLLLAAACSARPSTLKWTEEVRLPDQRVVTLTREQHFDEGDFVSSYWFEFRHPDTGETVRYENEREFTTVALYVHQKSVFLVVTPTFASHFDNAGCPSPPYFVFRYQDEQWKQVPLMQSPLSKVKQNMTLDPKQVRDQIRASDYKVTADQAVKMKENAGPFVAGFDLTSIKEQTFACPERKRYPLN